MEHRLSLDHHLDVVNFHLSPTIAGCFSCQVQPTIAGGAALCQTKHACLLAPVLAWRLPSILKIPVPVSRVQGGGGISLKQKRLPAEHIGHPSWIQAEETFVSIGQAQSWVNCLEGSSAQHYTTCGLFCRLLLQMRESSASCSSRSEPHQLPAPPDQSLASVLLLH